MSVVFTLLMSLTWLQNTGTGTVFLQTSETTEVAFLTVNRME